MFAGAVICYNDSMRHVYRISLQVFALLVIVLGIVGLFLPILQGILFIVVGIYLLTITSPAFKHRFDTVLIRFPRIKKHVDTHHSRIHSFFNKFRK
ncbi:MAG TPA: hypothetical protein PLB51_00720 [Candidatus Paceibacterota bacterium]|nr:hypothetical protein [Candidatus Paceibacterota bacterium]